MKRRAFIGLAIAGAAAGLALPMVLSKEPCKHLALYSGSSSGYRVVCADCGMPFDGELVGSGSVAFVLDKKRGRGTTKRPLWV